MPLGATPDNFPLFAFSADFRLSMTTLHSLKPSKRQVIATYYVFRRIWVQNIDSWAVESWMSRLDSRHIKTPFFATSSASGAINCSLGRSRSIVTQIYPHSRKPSINDAIIYSSKSKEKFFDASLWSGPLLPAIFALNFNARNGWHTTHRLKGDRSRESHFTLE